MVFDEFGPQTVFLPGELQAVGGRSTMLGIRADPRPLRPHPRRGQPAIFVRGCFWADKTKDEIMQKSCMPRQT